MTNKLVHDLFSVRGEKNLTTSKELTQERHATHGDFTDDATTSQGLKAVIQNSKNWTRFTPVQKECLEQMMTKIGRLCSGDPNYPDHWRDLSGYPYLVVERLPKVAPPDMSGIKHMAPAVMDPAGLAPLESDLRSAIKHLNGQKE